MRRIIAPADFSDAWFMRGIFGCSAGIATDAAAARYDANHYC